MAAVTLADPLTIRRLYGRRQVHALKPRAQSLVESLLPEVRVGPEGPLDARSLFGAARPLALEVGFGKGEHLAFQAALRPHWGFIGAEPFRNGVAGLLAEIDQRGLANIRIHEGDALDILERLPDGALAAAYVLHPDPWPKARHAKRRFVNPGPIGLLAAKMAPGAELRIATDHPLYLRHALVVIAQSPAFEWMAEEPRDWEAVPADWPDTRFARKARALGAEIWRLRYRRCA